MYSGLRLRGEREEGGTYFFCLWQNAEVKGQSKLSRAPLKTRNVERYTGKPYVDTSQCESDRFPPLLLLLSLPCKHTTGSSNSAPQCVVRPPDCAGHRRLMLVILFTSVLSTDRSGPLAQNVVRSEVGDFFFLRQREAGEHQIPMTKFGKIHNYPRVPKS